MPSDSDLLGCGKKRRLDHLTWEEKLQRKKLKNRVAAQTSRDRKKAKMDEMDITIKRLTEENQKLKEQNEELKRDNIELRTRMQGNQMGESVDEEKCIKVESMDSIQMCENEHWIGCGIENGSAVSSMNPLPKDVKMKPQSMQCPDNTFSHYLMTQQALTPPSTPPPAHQSMPFESNKRPQTIQHQQMEQSDDMPMNLKSNTNSAALWKIIALCLLYRTCSKISTPADWKNWPKAYSQMSQQTLKMMLQKAATELPKLKASQSQCLDQWWGPKQKSWNPAKIQMEA